jgi:DNA-directed RNA polymerase specialized sigma24 family protein
MADKDRDPPIEEGDPPGTDDERVAGDDPNAPALDRAVVTRFLGSKAALDVARAAARKVIPSEHVDDLTADAIARALRARPPRREEALVAWLTRIAERTAARWLQKRARRAKYEGPMPVHVAREDDYTGEVVDDGTGAEVGYDAEGDPEPLALLGPQLDRLVAGNAKEEELRAILREHAGGKSYKQICAERGYTEAQIANRIHRMKIKYGSRIRRERMIIFWLKGLAWAAALAAAAGVLWWLLQRRAPAPPPPSPAPAGRTPWFRWGDDPGPPVAAPRPPPSTTPEEPSAPDAGLH